MDKPFEEFYRHIAEVEICPNLLPQTGPTGGGDSKVDSETYPVSENLSAYWYFGNGIFVPRLLLYSPSLVVVVAQKTH